MVYTNSPDDGGSCEPALGLGLHFLVREVPTTSLDVVKMSRTT